VGKKPAGIAIDVQARKVFIANREDNTLTVLDADKPNWLATVKTGDSPYSVAFNAQKNQIYVGCVQGNVVTVIDADSYDVLASLPVKAPYGFAIADDGEQFFVT